MMASVASSSLSKILAGPSCTSISSHTAERFTTLPSGARFPFRTASPPVSLYGSSMGRMTSGFRFSHPLIFSPTVLPVTVMQSRLSRFFLLSSFITAYTPPASLRSSIYVWPAGARWHRFGVFSLIPLAKSISKSMPISWAMAGRWSILFVEHPSAMSTVSAFRMASSVIMSRGRMFLRTSSITCMPACFASCSLAE